MTQQAYRKLVEELCTAAGMNLPAPSQTVLDLQIKAVAFSLGYSADHAADHAVMYCDFGEIPEHMSTTVLLRLMQINLYLFGVNSPSFTANPDTQHIVLAAMVPLAGSNGERVLALLEGFAAMALEWRERHFLTAMEYEGMPVVAARQMASSTAGRMARFNRPG